MPVSVMERIRFLSKIIIPKFDEHILQWRSFCEQFELYVHNRAELSINCLCHSDLASLMNFICPPLHWHVPLCLHTNIQGQSRVCHTHDPASQMNFICHTLHWHVPFCLHTNIQGQSRVCHTSDPVSNAGSRDACLPSPFQASCPM